MEPGGLSTGVQPVFVLCCYRSCFNVFRASLGCSCFLCRLCHCRCVSVWISLRYCVNSCGLDFVQHGLHQQLFIPVSTVVDWLLACLTSQQHASVSQGRICSDNCTCCHTEIEVADHTFHFTQSQYTDTGPTSPSADPILPGAWQGSHWSANV